MMVFSPDSDVTLVLTSCGRFDLLKRTLDSIDQFNTAPIREVWITEDSGDDAVHACIPEHWRAHTHVLVNNPKLGQLRSIDNAYSQVKTTWIFHCEDDWEFYRNGFIEDSMELLQTDPQALQVWLRSHAHDLRIHSPYVYLKQRQRCGAVNFYRVGSHKTEWQGFSFNPGLRRLADYQAHAPYADKGGEKRLSKLYADAGRYALILENDAVLHTGFGQHVEIPRERKDKIRRSRRTRINLVATLVVGVFIGWVSSHL